MKKLLVLVLVASALAFATTASADRPYNGGVTVATPATACATLLHWTTVYSSFGECTTSIMADATSFQFPSDFSGELVNPFQLCAQAVAAGAWKYPFVFDEGPGWPFTTFSAHNNVQCGLTLYTYHTLATALGG
jgi:hypothetical protein